MLKASADNLTPDQMHRKVGASWHHNVADLLQPKTVCEGLRLRQPLAQRRPGPEVEALVRLRHRPTSHASNCLLLDVLGGLQHDILPSTS